jgi:molybdopterin/thiamine biosynthesis adenylyltransferase
MTIEKMNTDVMKGIYDKFNLFRNQHNFSDPIYYQLPRVMILGVGSVGSHIAENLSRLGIYDIKMIDGDILNPHNTISSTYHIAELYEKYWTEENLNRIISAYNRGTSVFRSIPYKVEVLAKRLKQINPMLAIITVTRFIEDLNIDQFNKETALKVKNGEIHPADLLKYNHPIDEIQTNLQSLVSTITKMNDIKWVLPDLFEERVEDDNLYALPQLSRYRMGSQYDKDDKFMQVDVSKFTDKYNHLFADHQDIVFLCADSFEARFNTLTQLRFFYLNHFNPTMERAGTMDRVKTTLPVIDTRVGNSIEGEVIVFDLLNDKDFKKWLSRIIDSDKTTPAKVYDFKNNVKKVNTIPFVNGGENLCGNTMSVMSAMMASTLAVNLFGLIYKNSEIPLLDKVHRYHTFKLGINSNEYSRFYINGNNI